MTPGSLPSQLEILSVSQFYYLHYVQKQHTVYQMGTDAGTYMQQRPFSRQHVVCYMDMQYVAGKDPR